MPEKGLFKKFRVQKVDEPMDEDAEYFVLRLDNDDEAVQAVLWWALRTGKSKLFEDIMDKYRPAGRIV